MITYAALLVYTGTRQPNQGSRQPRQPTSSSTMVEEEDPFIDDFDDDDGFDEVMLQGLEEIELQQQEQTSRTSNQTCM